MPQCEVCGNEYDKTMEITRGGETHVFDSFECAIHAIAPACDHCGCKIIGHGIEPGTAWARRLPPSIGYATTSSSSAAVRATRSTSTWSATS